MNFFKVSAKSGDGIQGLFRTIATKLYERNNMTQSKVASINDTKRPNSVHNNKNVSIGLADQQNKTNGGKCSCWNISI